MEFEVTYLFIVSYSDNKMPRYSNKLTKKRKFKGNRFTETHPKDSVHDSSSESEVDEEPSPNDQRPSASFSKLNDRPESFEYTKVSDRPSLDQSGFRLMDLSILNTVISSFSLCPNCRCKSLSLCENLEERKGWASNLSIICTKCQFSNSFYTSDKVDNKFECNVRLCYAMRSIGKAHKASELFSTIMNMPPPLATFQKYLPELHQATQKVCETSMTHAGKVG